MPERRALRAQVPTVELDEIFQAFDPQTAARFRAWQQDAGAGGRRPRPGPQRRVRQPAGVRAGRHRPADRARQPASAAPAWSATPASCSARCPRTRRSCTTCRHRPGRRSTRPPAQEALAETFKIFPTFLDESKETFARLETFSKDTDPLIQDLRPVARDLEPTLRDVHALAPDLRDLFVKLDPLITASKTGLPALRDTLEGRRRRCSASCSRSSSSSTRSCSGSSTTS